MNKFFLSALLIQATTTLAFSQQSTSYFSAVQGASSRVDSLVMNVDPGQISVEISGPQANHFQVKKKQAFANPESTVLQLLYSPPSNFKGTSQASLTVKGFPSREGTSHALRGLGVTGLEGNHENSLSEIFQVLSLATDPGWTTLANHIGPEKVGDEINTGLFQKAGEGPVTIVPVARYSPPYSLPFGFYFPAPTGPELRQIGVLADSKTYHEHQTLYPTVALGGTSFDPAKDVFGLYVVSPTHNSFTEDLWNHLRYPNQAGHAVRTYPAIQADGHPIPNTYLVCFEEASNGDYQDYVFLVSNIKPVNPELLFTTLLQEQDLSGWQTFLQTKGVNSDPELVFTVKDGVLHDTGKELGYVLTEQEYQNYHFRLQFKWGEKKWPPRDQAKRDSGICYHISATEEDRIWPQSVECQIQEGDVGDFWLLGYCTIEVNGKQNQPMRHSQIVKARDNEFPNGEWNTVEVLTFNGTCVHLVNGQVVNYGTNSSLRKGKILLQSEYAEIYYRKVEIREL